MGEKIKEDSQLQDDHEKVGRKLFLRFNSKPKFFGELPPGKGDARAVFVRQMQAAVSLIRAKGPI